MILYYTISRLPFAWQSSIAPGTEIGSDIYYGACKYIKSDLVRNRLLPFPRHIKLLL